MTIRAFSFSFSFSFFLSFLFYLSRLVCTPKRSVYDSHVICICLYLDGLDRRIYVLTKRNDERNRCITGVVFFPFLYFSALSGVFFCVWSIVLGRGLCGWILLASLASFITNSLENVVFPLSMQHRVYAVQLVRTLCTPYRE